MPLRALIRPPLISAVPWVPMAPAPPLTLSQQFGDVPALAKHSGAVADPTRPVVVEDVALLLGGADLPPALPLRANWVPPLHPVA